VEYCVTPNWLMNLHIDFPCISYLKLALGIVKTKQIDDLRFAIDNLKNTSACRAANDDRFLWGPIGHIEYLRY
jgi:hypothetical protein